MQVHLLVGSRQESENHGCLRRSKWQTLTDLCASLLELHDKQLNRRDPIVTLFDRLRDDSGWSQSHVSLTGTDCATDRYHLDTSHRHKAQGTRHREYLWLESASRTLAMFIGYHIIQPFPLQQTAKNCCRHTVLPISIHAPRCPSLCFPSNTSKATKPLREVLPHAEAKNISAIRKGRRRGTSNAMPS